MKTGIWGANVDFVLITTTGPSLLAMTHRLLSLNRALPSSSAIHLGAGAGGLLRADVTELGVAFSVVPAVPRHQLLHAIFVDPIDKEQATIIRHTREPMSENGLA